MSVACIEWLIVSDLSQQYLGKMGGVANESTVEILYQLGTVQDTWTADRYAISCLYMRCTCTIPDVSIRGSVKLQNPKMPIKI